MPGAFTKTCSAKHLPGFINNYENAKAKGITKIVCISVNDPFVMNAWGKQNDVGEKIVMMGDPFLNFTKEIGADVDKSGRGLGIRSNRYTMFVDNMKLIKLQEDDIYLVVSGDKDFIQLHQSDNVKQYSPTLKKFIVDENPEQYKFEHIIRGDKGDGVPNVLSQDTVFVEDLRQRPITKKKLTEWKENGIPEGEIKRNYQRNTSLIDLSKVPEDIEEQIIKEYTKPVKGNRKKLLNYFTEKKLRELTENIGEF